MTKNWLLASVCALSLTGFCGVAAAADAQLTAPNVQKLENLDEVVITAQRRDERMVDVPIAMTAVSGRQLQDVGILSSAQLGQVVPGLRLDLSGAFFQPTIRGVGSAIAGVGLASNVGTYIDGVYRPSPFSTNFQLPDIESIQVLKGPQGTLFGRNATGGAIMVTTTEPSFVPTATGVLRYGRYNETLASFVGSRGVSDTVALGFSGQWHKSDGFVKNVTTGSDAGDFERIVLRGKLLYQPTDKLSMLLTVDHYEADDQSIIAYTAYDGRTFARDYVPVPTGRGEVATDIKPLYQVRRDGASLKATYKTKGVKFTSITSYSDEKVPHQNIDFDASALPGLSVDIPFNVKKFSQEFTAASDGGGNFNWVGGVYYFDDNGYQPSYDATVGGVGPTDFFHVGVKTKAYALFADATNEISPNLFLTVGARYSSEDQKAYAFFPGSGYRTDNDASFDGFTPRAVLRYKFEDGSNAYASYNRGFKAGGFAPTTGDLSNPFNSETINAFEVGYKTGGANFKLETSLFYYDYSNIQIASYTSGVGIIRNAAQSEVYGADIQLDYRASDKLTLQGSVAYTHSEYSEFEDAEDYQGDGSALDPIHIAIVSASGNPMIRTPEWTGTFSATYNQPVATGDVRLFASYYATSKFTFDPVGRFGQDAYGLLSARASYTPTNSPYSFSLYGNNLTDETYLTQVLPFSGAILQTYGAPATYGIELGFKF